MKPILKLGRNCWKIAPVESSGLIVDGRDYYRAFYHAARSAKRYIAISGWQFDSNVPLLRGPDAEAAGEEAPLLSFLNGLCEKNPELRVFILAWDFSFVYGLDREWFLQWYVTWMTHESLKFSFDRSAVYDASHHQKFVVIDDKIAFVGGLDLCSSRWDERDHRVENPLRVNADGSPYRSFHDLQSCHSGPIARHLAELFETRWKIASGEDLELPAEPPNGPVELMPSLSIVAKQVAVSRTQNCAVCGGDESFREIRQLFLDAIDAAEHLIYVENQYFSSEALYKGLLRRMTKKKRSPLEIVLVIAKDAEGLLEQLSIGVAQNRIVRGLQQAARDNGHHLGIYYPASAGADGTELATYIHSKFLLVDDRFLSVGSANMNNRSMGYDTELNVSWEAGRTDHELARSIGNVRVDLLAEHTGQSDDKGRQALSRIQGLVEHLDQLADSGATRLRHHPLESIAEEYQWMTTVLPDGLPFDSERSEEAYEKMATKEDSFFTRGVTSLKSWLLNSD
ncbi:MAG TPA: phospholipase D-like domain-containing protein [Candidatus Binatia bacterium]